MEFCSTNISNIETIIVNFDKVISAIQNNDSNVEEIINNYNKTYSELNTIIMKTTSDIEHSILSIAEKS